MNKQPIELARDADLRSSLVAMQRASLRAREIARQTGTCLVVSRNGLVELLDPDAPELDAPSVQESVSLYKISPDAA